MANRYEKKSNAELIEILELRSLSLTGKKADYIARLLEYDHKIQRLESTRPNNMPDVELISGRFLLYNGSTPRMHATFSRIRSALEQNDSPFEIVDLNNVGLMYMFWEKESKGRRLPALVKQGRIIGVSYNNISILMIWCLLLSIQFTEL